MFVGVQWKRVLSIWHMDKLFSIRIVTTNTCNNTWTEENCQSVLSLQFSPFLLRILILCCFTFDLYSGIVATIQETLVNTLLTRIICVDIRQSDHPLALNIDQFSNEFNMHYQSLAYVKNSDDMILLSKAKDEITMYIGRHYIFSYLCILH